MRNICSAEGCSDLCHGRGYCKKHYWRFRKHGDATKTILKKNICSINECNSFCHGYGLCWKHYMRSRKHGDPNFEYKPVAHNKGKRKFSTPEQEFLYGFLSGSQDDCWIWEGVMSDHGYGMIAVYPDGKRKKIGAHRFSYEFYVGKIPDRVLVCHRCDNRACVNPWHLFLGSVADNNNDCMLKGRHIAPKGSRSGAAKLTEFKVIEIRKSLAAGITGAELGRKYGVTKECINLIRRGINWKHVKEG